MSGRAAWRGLDALLAVRRSGEHTDVTAWSPGFHTSELLVRIREIGDRLPSGYPLQLELTGITYGAKLGHVEDTFHDEIPLPIAALEPDGTVQNSLLGAVAQAERLAGAVNRLSADLRRAAGSDPLPRDAWQYPGEACSTLSTPGPRPARRPAPGRRRHRPVRGGLERWEEKAGRATWRVAGQLLSGTTPGQFTGRAAEKEERTYRLSEAERAFRKDLDRILWRSADKRWSD
ncbi:type I-E CRISPR-associated protein Cse1/CasA [Streptomyces sp. M19]